MWALTEVMQTNQTTASIGRFDVSLKTHRSPQLPARLILTFQLTQRQRGVYHINRSRRLFFKCKINCGSAPGQQPTEVRGAQQSTATLLHFYILSDVHYLLRIYSFIIVECSKPRSLRAKPLGFFYSILHEANQGRNEYKH